MFVPHRKNTYGTPGSVTGIALLFYMSMMLDHHRKHTYMPPRPVSWIDLLHILYVDDVLTPEETPMGLHGLLRE
jgi:hypothetical protein